MKYNSVDYTKDELLQVAKLYKVKSPSRKNKTQLVRSLNRVLKSPLSSRQNNECSGVLKTNCARPACHWTNRHRVKKSSCGRMPRRVGRNRSRSPLRRPTFTPELLPHISFPEPLEYSQTFLSPELEFLEYAPEFSYVEPALTASSAPSKSPYRKFDFPGNEENVQKMLDKQIQERKEQLSSSTSEVKVQETIKKYPDDIPQQKSLEKSPKRNVSPSLKDRIAMLEHKE